MIFDEIKEQYPFFYKVTEYLENSCFFFKTVLTELKALDLDYDYCEDLCLKGFALSNKDDEIFYRNLHSLVAFSLEFLRLQGKLVKTGKYLYSTVEEVEKYAYNDPNRELTGPWYMMALYFSQVFWVTHYKVNEFFLKDVCNRESATGKALEIPSGSGIFISNFLSRNRGWKGTGLDLSESSIEFSKKVIKLYDVTEEQLTLIKQDFFLHESEGNYDLIICGEFLEHLEQPLAALKKIHSLLNDGGEVFLTVAVYAAMIDHIYLYNSAQEVRDHIAKAGFEIKKELVQNVFAKAQPEERDTPINYSAILIKK